MPRFKAQGAKRLTREQQATRQEHLADYLDTLEGDDSRGTVRSDNSLVRKAAGKRPGTPEDDRRQQASPPPKYVYPVFKPTAAIRTEGDWQGRESRFVEGSRAIHFGPDFDVRDYHLDQIIAVGDPFCKSLLDFRAGDADTGWGANLSDAALVRLAQACPNLRHVQIEGARNVGDETLLAFLINCSASLEFLQISGNDKVAGKIKGTPLMTLRRDPKLCKNLRKLNLTDQAPGLDKVVKNLSKSRKALEIVMGCTHERYGDVMEWRAGKEAWMPPW